MATVNLTDVIGTKTNMVTKGKWNKSSSAQKCVAGPSTGLHKYFEPYMYGKFGSKQLYTSVMGTPICRLLGRCLFS